MTGSLTAAGLVVPRAADLRATFRAAYEASTGLVIDWDRDTVLGPVSVLVSEREGALAELLQAVYDGWDRGAAQGAQLDGLGLLIGLPRKGATRGAVVLTLTGTAGTVIPAGSLVQGGGADGRARWEIPDDVTLTGGTATVTARAVEPGAIVATAGQVAVIVPPVSGWSSVTNAADAAPGTDIEGDAAYRARQQDSLQVSAGRSIGGIEAAVLAVEGVESAVAVENDTATAATVGGVVLEAHSFGVIVWPEPLADDVLEAVALAIYARKPAGIKSIGFDALITVTSSSTTTTIRLDYADATTVDVVIGLTMESGWAVADVEDAIDDALALLFGGLGIGDPVRRLDIYGILAAIEGIAAVPTLTLNGSAADITPNKRHIARLGTVAVS